MMALTWLCTLGDALATLQWEPLHKHTQHFADAQRRADSQGLPAHQNLQTHEELDDSRARKQGQTAAQSWLASSCALACQAGLLCAGTMGVLVVCKQHGLRWAVPTNCWHASSRGQGECSQQYAVWGRGEEAGGFGSYMHLREPV